MIRNVKIKNNNMTIDWDQEDYDFFFRSGLQIMADEHFAGQRKVVVLPVDDPVIKDLSLKNKSKNIEVSDEFADLCVTISITDALKKYIANLETEADS